MFNLPPNSFCAMITVFLLLSTASILRLCLPDNSKANALELRLRIQSWWWMLGLLLVALTISRSVAIGFFGFLSFLALKEFLSIVPTRQTDRRVIFWAYLAIPIQYYWVAKEWYAMFIIFVPIYVFLFLPMRMILTGETKGFIRSCGIIHWGVMLTVFGLSHVAYLLMLPVKNVQAGNIGLVLFLIFMTQFNDVGQYIWGKLCGRHKIIPKVSPNKTWEGFLGGLLTITVCCGVIAPFLTPLSFWHGLSVGLIIGVSGFIGDVVLSAVKRDLQIKDSGSLIPGHGGILDRLDSLLYTSPLFFHYLVYFYY